MGIWDLLDRKLIFVTGKGGVGKSTVAATLALLASSRGKNVLLLEQAPFSHQCPLFKAVSRPHEVMEYAPLIRGMNLTLPGNFRDFISLHLKLPQIFDQISESKILRSFFYAIPGFSEILLLGRIYYAAALDANPADIIIVDSFASGHFLSLMTTPAAILSSGLGGPVSRETEKLITFLRDSAKVATIFVGLAEMLVRTEVEEFSQKLLEKSPASLAGIVFNRMSGHNESDVKISGEIPHFYLKEMGWIHEPISQETARLIWQKHV